VYTRANIEFLDDDSVLVEMCGDDWEDRKRMTFDDIDSAISSIKEEKNKKKEKAGKKEKSLKKYMIIDE